MKLNLYSVSPILITNIFGLERNSLAKGSIARSKRAWERGHPCLTPVIIITGELHKEESLKAMGNFDMEKRILYNC